MPPQPWLPASLRPGVLPAAGVLSAALSATLPAALSASGVLPASGLLRSGSRSLWFGPWARFAPRQAGRPRSGLPLNRPGIDGSLARSHR